MKRSFYIAGVQFRPQQEINKAVGELKVGDKLILSPEPTNRFDPNAVKIGVFGPDVAESVFLGYVPKKFSAEVAGLLEVGIGLECVVEAVDPAAKPWEKCKVTIREAVEQAGPDVGDGPDYDEGDREP
jgi:hypothetical protein